MNTCPAEYIEEEPSTPEEIADACEEVIDYIPVYKEIAAQSTAEDAYRLAVSALSDYIDDPEGFLRGKGILV